MGADCGPAGPLAADPGCPARIGSSGAHILRLIVGQGLTLAVAGVALGLGMAVDLTRVTKSLSAGIGLLQVSATDVSTHAAVALLFLLVALPQVASWRFGQPGPIRRRHCELDRSQRMRCVGALCWRVGRRSDRFRKSSLPSPQAYSKIFCELLRTFVLRQILLM